MEDYKSKSEFWFIFFRRKDWGILGPTLLIDNHLLKLIGGHSLSLGLELPVCHCPHGSVCFTDSFSFSSRVPAWIRWAFGLAAPVPP